MRTIRKQSSQPIYLWADIQNDLWNQGEGVTIDPRSVQNNFCAGYTGQNTPFFTTCYPDGQIVSVVGKDEPSFIATFSRVMEYGPFCQYEDPPIGEERVFTYEWKENDSEGRFAELQKEGKTNLQRL